MPKTTTPVIAGSRGQSRRPRREGPRIIGDAWCKLYGSIEVENSQGFPQDGPAVASPAAAVGPQPRGMEDADEESNADTSSVTFTQVGESWANSQTLGIDAEEAVVNYRSCGASYGAQDLSNAQARFKRSNARAEETVNVDTG